MEHKELNSILSTVENTGHETIEYNMTRFVQILRHLGVRVSLAETMDAMSALASIDLLDQHQFKGVLRACLAKSRKEAGIFDHAFNLFFTTPEEKLKRRQQRREEQAERVETIHRAEQELMEVMEDWQQELTDRIELTDQQLETFSLLTDSQKEKMKDTLERMKSNPVNNPGELINRVLQSSLNYWRYHMMKNMPDVMAPQLDLEASLTGDEELDEVIQGVTTQFYHHPGDRLLYQDMESIDDADIPRITSLINHLSSQLALGISRRYKRSARAVAIDIRRTVRKNIKYGGIPIELCYRARRRKRPHFILLCDVSASMARYARFVLQFMYGLNSALGGIESFIFSEDLERTTDHFSKQCSFAQSMADMMNDSQQWGKATNLAVSLRTFLRFYANRLTPETFIFIVSDAKTVAPESSAALLRDIKNKCSDVIWLNTLPQREWEKKSPARVFAKVVEMYESNTLANLEKALRLHVLKKL